MDSLFSQEALIAFYRTAEAWLTENVLTSATLLQLSLLLLSYILARPIARRLSVLFEKLVRDRSWKDRFTAIAQPCYLHLSWLILIGLAMAGLDTVAMPSYVLTIAATLLLAWIAIGLATILVKNPELSRAIQLGAWAIAALNIIGLLAPTLELLDSVAIETGELRLSVLSITTGIFTFTILVWGSIVLSGVLEKRLKKTPGLTPALQVLFGKITKIVLIGLAVIIGLSSAGIDLTAFAVFGGAIGVGIGFGLQKVISNLISGVILLLDRSIKPGDVIEVGGSYGWINSMAARYTSVITRDGTEHLIPNEDIITQPVINWTYSHTRVRRRIPLNVAYNTDLRQAMALMNEAATETERVISDPAPRVLLKGFGDNGVDLELRMWINDPQHGVSNVASEVMLKIWDKFEENDIKFPFPQRDVHLVSGEAPT